MLKARNALKADAMRAHQRVQMQYTTAKVSNAVWSKAAQVSLHNVRQSRRLLHTTGGGGSVESNVGGGPTRTRQAPDRRALSRTRRRREDVSVNVATPSVTIGAYQPMCKCKRQVAFEDLVHILVLATSRLGCCTWRRCRVTRVQIPFDHDALEVCKKHARKA